MFKLEMLCYLTYAYLTRLKPCLWILFENNLKKILLTRHPRNSLNQKQMTTKNEDELSNL